jgi:organic hydroperoxide reductase OsmC/OhrA
MNHRYETHLRWRGETASYEQYTRRWSIAVDGKPTLSGSADPHFRGEPALHNPEDLFLAALSACHCLTYLALCARQGVTVLAYEDQAMATMSSQFDEVVLRPQVTLRDEAQLELARRLHVDAHAQCFLARSVRCPVLHDARFVVSS